jgi:catechol 2,3-dioxygenase-like lactoylglutathione lyase family enzyme
VAVSVQDIEAVTKWYTKNLGFQVIGGKIMHMKRADTPDSPIFTIYGDSLHEVKLAYMATGNGVGFEIFQFIKPGFRENEADFEYHRSGFFHVCVTDPTPDVLADQIVADGGSRQGSAVTLAGGVRCIYVKDPWGHVIEILSVAFDRLATMDTM